MHAHRRRVRRHANRCASTNTGKTMRFRGISILKVVNGLITEELGLDDGVTVLEQLALIKPS